MQSETSSSGLPQFTNIILSPTGLVGTLKFSGHGIGWKARSGEQSKSNNNSITILAKDLLEAVWIRTGKKSFQLSLLANTDAGSNKEVSQYKFEGFQDADRSNISNFLKSSFQTELKSESLATKGSNWGSFELEDAGNRLVFKVQDKTAFDVPLSRVSQTQLSKNELILEFNHDDIVANNETLLEMRFSIPTIKEGTKEGGKASAEEGGEEDGDGESADDTQITIMSPQLFHKQLVTRLGGRGGAVGGAGGAGGGALVFLPKVKFLAPRGRYDVEMYPNFFKLHGSTYSYQIKHDHISRLLVLPRGEGDAVFVVSLDPPIRQGQTTYPHLLLQASTINKIQGLSLNIKKEHEKKFDGIKELLKISKDEENEEENEDDDESRKSSELQVIQKAFEVFHGKKSAEPSTFKGHFSHPWVKCSFKANDGYLYPLEKSFFFIHKPPIHIPFATVAHVEFSRVGGLHSTFDFTITVRAGQSSRDGNSVTYVFNNIDKSEISNLQSFVSSKKITISSHASVDDTTPTQETTRPASSSSSAPTIATANLADDEESEEDEDFVAKDEDDIDEEFFSGSDEEEENEEDEDEEEKKSKSNSIQKKRPADPISSKQSTKKAKADEASD